MLGGSLLILDGLFWMLFFGFEILTGQAKHRQGSGHAAWLFLPDSNAQPLEKAFGFGWVEIPRNGLEPEENRAHPKGELVCVQRVTKRKKTC